MSHEWKRGIHTETLQGRKRSEVLVWKCGNCGLEYPYKSATPPDTTFALSCEERQVQQVHDA